MTQRTRLPLIPLSPLIQRSCDYAMELAQITQFLSESHTPDTTAVLEKSLVKEREKLDRLTKNMQAIQSCFLVDFNIYDIAKEIAYINCSLFRMVTLDKKWICNFDKQSNMIPLLDFHRYLAHSFAHQIIVGDNHNAEDTNNATARNCGIVAQLIRLAYILLHVYRDFSGCSAILTSLEMPQVQRQQTKWSSCPSKLITVYKELVKMLSPHNNYEAYYHQLWLHTARFLNTTPNKSQMIAVPFMHAHLFIIRNLVQTHSSSSSSSEVEAVLSDAGQKTLISALHLLQFCQQYFNIDPIELEKYAASSTLQRRLSSQSNKRYSAVRPTSYGKLSIPVCLQLDQLRGDANIYHWLVSRAYLSCSQLHCESLFVEPQAVGETIVEVEEEEYDLYWDFFSQDGPVKLDEETNKREPTAKTNGSLSSVVKKGGTNKQNAVDDLAIVTTVSSGMSDSEDSSNNQSQSPVIVEEEISLNSKSPEISENEEEISNETSDTVPSSSVEVTTEAEIDIPVSTTKIEMTKEQEVQDNSDLDEKDGSQGNHAPIIAITSEEENTHTSTEQAAEHSQDDISSPALETNDQKENKHQEDAVAQPTLNENTSSVPLVPKPILSPAAPEFIPQAQSTATSEIEEIDYMDNEDEDEDDDVIILTEEDDEEWTGYPIDSTPSPAADTEEEEEWTGYPFASQDEDDDDEVWKGYPVPQEEQLQVEGNKSISAPSTPQEEQQTLSRFDEEEWRGYQNASEEEKRKAAKRGKVNPNWNGNARYNQLHAIGKAAARRMQYSLSNTDANRKRLPSPFAPSAST